MYGTVMYPILCGALLSSAINYVRSCVHNDGVFHPGLRHAQVDEGHLADLNYQHHLWNKVY